MVKITHALATNISDIYSVFEEIEYDPYDAPADVNAVGKS